MSSPPLLAETSKFAPNGQIPKTSQNEGFSKNLIPIKIWYFRPKNGEPPIPIPSIFGVKTAKQLTSHNTKPKNQKKAHLL